MDPLERTLILARTALTPSSADDERARRALGLRPNTPAASATRALTHASVWAALRGSGGAGAAIGALLVGLGFAGGYWVGYRESAVPAVASLPAPPPATARDAILDRHVPLEGRSAPASEVPAEALESPRPVSPAPRARTPLASSKAPARAVRAGAPHDARVLDPSEELALLRRIEKSLRSNEPALALALLGELGERFPETRLGEERAAATVLVHCALRDPDSHRRAEEFLGERASSVYADRVRSSCWPRAPQAPEPEAAPASAQK